MCCIVEVGAADPGAVRAETTLPTVLAHGIVLDWVARPKLLRGLSILGE